MDPDRLLSNLDVLRDRESEEFLDEAFALLSDRLTRYVLYYLADRSASDLETLADVVTGMDAVETDSIQTPPDYERNRIRLYHVTLPRLAAEGYIEFDASEQRVTAVEIPESITQLLHSDP